MGSVPSIPKSPATPHLGRVLQCLAQRSCSVLAIYRLLFSGNKKLSYRCWSWVMEGSADKWICPIGSVPLSFLSLPPESDYCPAPLPDSSLCGRSWRWVSAVHFSCCCAAGIPLFAPSIPTSFDQYLPWRSASRRMNAVLMGLCRRALLASGSSQVVASSNEVRQGKWNQWKPLPRPLFGGEFYALQTTLISQG